MTFFEPVLQTAASLHLDDFISECAGFALPEGRKKNPAGM